MRSARVALVLGLILLAAAMVPGCKPSGGSAGSGAGDDGSAVPPEPGQLAIGSAAPALSLEVAGTGEKLSLPGNMSGKPYGLLFFSYG